VTPAYGHLLAPGTAVGDGRFAVTRILGEGSQATTYEAVDKRDGRLVALKQFSVPRAQSWKDVELAEREALVLSSLNHPLVPHYVTHFEEAGSLFLAMEKVEGEPLSVLKARGALDRNAVVRFLEDVAETLDYLHRQSPPIIHRDIKPSNVVRRADGRYVLVDFGSVQHRLRPEGGSTVVGTYGYMAPEQFQGRALAATDRYAVGATALALLTGVAPEDQPHKGLGIDVGKALSGSVPAPLQRLLETLLDPDPDNRSRESLRELLARNAIHSAAEPHFERPRAPENANRSERASRHESRAERKRERRKRRDSQHPWHAYDPHDHRQYDRWRSDPFQSREARLWLASPPALITVLLGLWAARVVTGVALLLVVPTLLMLLSIVFGPGLRRGADKVRIAGHRTRRALRHVAAKAREAAAAPFGVEIQDTTGETVGEDSIPRAERQRVAETRRPSSVPDDVERVGRDVEEMEKALEEEMEKVAREVEERLSRR
jgi:serine/threonine protein kinase